MLSFIDREGIKNLKQYKYSGVDKSITAKYVLQPYWTWLVTLFPLWMAPNLITLTGLCFVFFNVLTMLYYSPNMDESCPSWVYYSFTVGLFLYTSFDAVDGKQARRTNSSSPLGELFDHGCDALNTVLGTYITAHVVDVQNTWIHYLFLAISTGYFFVSTWETFHTGTLYLGYINGPVEGTIFLCGLYAFTGFVGRDFWAQRVGDVIDTDSAFFSNLQVNHVSVVLFLTITLGMMASSFINLPADARKQKYSLAAAYGRLSPMLFIVCSGAVWIHFSGIDILHSHMVALQAALGLEFCMLVARLIVAHLTHRPFPMWQPGFVFLFGISAALVASSFGIVSVPPTFELRFLYAYLSFNVLYYSIMVKSIIDQICAFLDINCLTLKKTAKAT